MKRVLDIAQLLKPIFHLSLRKVNDLQTYRRNSERIPFFCSVYRENKGGSPADKV